MSDNVNSIIIGGIPTHRGVYNANSTYYEGNQVVYFGSVFSAKSNNFSNIPPLSVANDGTVSVANNVYWDIITDNIELYNATLSEKNLDKRVGTLETNIAIVTKNANEAKTTAEATKTTAEAAKTATEKSAKNIISLASSVKTNTDNIAANKKAITALQLGASPLAYECNIDGDTEEWDLNDGQNEKNMVISFKVLDGNDDVTESAITTASIYCPDGSKMYINGQVSSLNINLTVPGEYIIDIKSTLNGRSANATWKFMLVIPVIISKKLNEDDAQTDYRTFVKKLPVSIPIEFEDKFEGILRIFSPLFLANNVNLSCNGIQVPTTSKTEDKYILLNYVGGIQKGTYNFTINKQ